MTASTQQLRYQSLKNLKFQQVSISFGIWFGTRGAEVQILYPPTNHFNAMRSQASYLKPEFLTYFPSKHHSAGKRSSIELCSPFLRWSQKFKIMPSLETAGLLPWFHDMARWTGCAGRGLTAARSFQRCWIRIKAVIGRSHLHRRAALNGGIYRTQMFWKRAFFVVPAKRCLLT